MHEAVWKALADPTRRELLDQIKGEPRTTGELVERMARLDRCTVMKHLEILVKANLVVVERRGVHRYNHINPAPLHEIVERWVSGHTARMANAAFRLQRIAEEGNNAT